MHPQEAQLPNAPTTATVEGYTQVKLLGRGGHAQCMMIVENHTNVLYVAKVRPYRQGA